jgi:hypothetical protein
MYHFMTFPNDNNLTRNSLLSWAAHPNKADACLYLNQHHCWQVEGRVSWLPNRHVLFLVMAAPNPNSSNLKWNPRKNGFGR